jgi:uncharacterized protein (DUF58 family)
MATPTGLSGSKTAQGDGERMRALEHDAHALADVLPDLLLDAERIASTVAHGIHGRRRAGPGETFWQFRQYSAQDSAQLIDWRRSASSDLLYVREREWEAAHTLWLWPDLSPSMNFKYLGSATKRDRAVVLMLAAAELLVRSGERVGLMGVTSPFASRKAASRLAEALAQGSASSELTHSLPPDVPISRFSSVILFGDFLDPAEDVCRRIEEIAARGAGGHIVQVLDPAEETLPYEGRTEFLGLEGNERWIAGRAETLREEYRARLAAHRAVIADCATRLGWSFMVHHTDRPGSELLLALMMSLEGKDGLHRLAPDGAPGTAAGGNP